MDLSGFAPGQQTGRTLKTNIGTWQTYGEPGMGGSVVGDPYSMQVRREATYGREPDLAGGYYLDSNDADTVRLRLPSWAKRATLIFQDLADRPGTTFTARVGQSYAQIAGQRNGARNVLDVLLDGERDLWFMTRGMIPSASNPGLRDDGYSVRVAVAPIPLPAGAWLMLAAFGGLGALKGRGWLRKRAAA